MSTTLRTGCASPRLLAIVCICTAINASAVQGQTSFAPATEPVYVEDSATSPQDVGYYYDQSLQGVGHGDCCEQFSPCDDAACHCVPCEPCCVPFFVFGEFLYLRASDADVAHAQQQNGIGGAGTVPFGRIGTVDIDYEPAYRFGGGIGLDACSSLIVSYTRFDGNGSDLLVAPTVPGGGGAVGSLVQHPGAAITASAGPVTADYDIDYHLADVLFRDVWRSGNCYVLNYSVGAQYANLDQEFSQSGIFSGGSAGVIDTDTDIEFDGGGIKVGLDGERWLTSRLSVYGKASASALSGRFNSRYSLENSTTDVLLAEAIWKDNRVISLVEYELGLALTSCNSRWRGSVGYLFQHWGNVVTTSGLIQGVQADNYSDISDVISFDGLTSRLEYRW